MRIKTSFLSLIFLFSVSFAHEKNSTPCYPVGELGAKWEFTSDHLPVGLSINGHHFVSWNILDRNYLRWIKQNGQGLKKSALLRDNVPAKQNSKLTVREERVIEQILALIEHPTHPRSLLALQETNQVVYDALKERLPDVYLSTAITHGDTFFYDSRLFEQVELIGDAYQVARNTWTLLKLQDRTTGELYTFIQSHVPGGDLFAKDLGWVQNPFRSLDILYPTHVNTLREASWIDNIFIAGPLYKTHELSVSAASDFFEELEKPASTLVDLFPLFDQVAEAKGALPDNSKIQALFAELLDEWKFHYLNLERNFDLEGLLKAVSYAAEKHEGQYRKDAEATPYIIHPLQVCRNLWSIGNVRSTNVLIAAILHDTLEDTNATFEEISPLFNHRVATTVEELSNDPTLNTQQNKQRQVDHAPLMSQDARLVKLADRLANIMGLSTPPPSWNQEKVRNYFEWGKKLLHALEGTNASLERELSLILFRI